MGDDFGLDVKYVANVIVFALVRDRGLGVGQAGHLDSVECQCLVVRAIHAVPVHFEDRWVHSARIISKFFNMILIILELNLLLSIILLDSWHDHFVILIGLFSSCLGALASGILIRPSPVMLEVL